MAKTLPDYYQLVQKSCLPGIWSKGVSLARDNLVSIDSFSEKEIVLRVKASDRAVSPKVSLWPEDEDYYCDCGDRAVPCAHVAASIAALKNGLKASEITAVSQPKAKSIRYRFMRQGRGLLFQRWIGTTPLKLNESLVSLMGGVSSGRVSEHADLLATQEDFAIDQSLDVPMGRRPESALDRAGFVRLFRALKSVAGIELDTQPVQVGPPTRGVSVEVRDDGPGFRLIGVEDSSITEVFENGILLTGSTLRLLEDPGLSPRERQMLTRPGKWFSPAETSVLMSEIIPALEKKLPVRILANKLPHVASDVSDAPPKIVLHLEKTGEHTLTVTPSIAYPSEYSVRDPNAERVLMRKLQSDLHLSPGNRIEFRGLAAVNFVKLAENQQDGSNLIDITGDAASQFRMESALHPSFSSQTLDLSFKSTSGKNADPSEVLRAWKDGESHIPLLGGGYAPLPIDWLKKYGSRIQRLLSLREEGEGKLPTYLRPTLVEIAQEMGEEIPDPLIAFQSLLENFEKIPEAPLPKDLHAELRHYQVQGVNWLNFLRKSEMGALLADDMGLGKTLQALCAIEGKTLVVAPTSVLHSWKDQIHLFRPSQKVALFYGSNRKFDTTADITLTSYGLLRQDKEKLLKYPWKTIILDEAQMIKNPDSQVARAAHALALKAKGAFRMTLSGTPVENSMEDLWSQLQFLNPGILGSKKEFQEEFVTPITKGDETVAKKLRTRIKPFVLRRLKRDVAPELPPRTEVVLNCQLSESEKELYDSLLASGRKEVIEKLQEGGSVFHALEMLLRLRQACCHPNLVPGQNAETSSKLELLAETLEKTVANGHRALVFSQWTSFLDLIGPRLTKMGLGFTRLDGSTQNREKVVAEFQDPAGPPVMLISLKAGGVGLTLTAADHVFLMDSWWNPAVEDQAADRAHRIGQENPVLICRLITENTLEEKILELQKQKQELSQSILEGTAQAVSLTRDDILALLK
jgi:superfamily II DNA or RNA helicase